MIVPFGIQDYRRADLPRVKLSNMYAESAETVPGNVVLMPRPALKPRATVGGGPINGLFYQPGVFGNAVFALSGSTLYSNSAAIGTVAATSLVQMAAADTALLIANGAGLSRYDGTTTTPVAFPDGAGVVSVVFLGGYAFAARANSRRFYFALDTAAWDGLDYLSAEQSTDYIVGLAVVVDQLWVFCQRHIEIFYLTGDADAPVQRVQGRVFDKGALSRDAIVKMDNTVFWVGSDQIVYRGGDAPLRVSNHGIEELIAESEPADIVGWTFPWKGHLFYVLQLTDCTRLYDVATQQWFETESYDLPRWRGRIGVQVGKEIVVGDDVTGATWTLADDLYRDGDDPIAGVWTVLINKPGFVDCLTIDISAGDLPSPVDAEGLVEMRTSRDGGKTWLEWQQCGLGRQGQYRTSANFNRLGMVDRGDMVVQMRVTDAVAHRVSNVRLNDLRAGRGR